MKRFTYFVVFIATFLINISYGADLWKWNCFSIAGEDPIYFAFDSSCKEGEENSMVTGVCHQKVECGEYYKKAQWQENEKRMKSSGAK